MAADIFNEPGPVVSRQYLASKGYNIYGRPGHFTVNFTSPYNSLHQISGFKSEHDARAWIDEARLLEKTTAETAVMPQRAFATPWPAPARGLALYGLWPSRTHGP